MGSLHTFEIELSKDCKERKTLVRLRALLSKNFERAIKRLNAQAKGNFQFHKFVSRMSFIQR